MPRANRKPTATAAAEHPAMEPTVADLCHEWRLVNAKREYETAALPDTDEGDEESDKIVAKANDHIIEIEDALAASEPESLDDVQAILGVVLKNMEEQSMGEDRDRDMLRATNWGLNRLRNKTGGEALPRLHGVVEGHLDRARDLEPKVCDVAKQARMTEILVDELMDELIATGAIPRDDIEMYRYAAHQLREISLVLRTKYYEALWPEEGRPASQ